MVAIAAVELPLDEIPNGSSTDANVLNELHKSGICTTFKDDPDYFFRKESEVAAKILCFACPVRILCLRYAITEDMPFGVWGGTTETERRKMPLKSRERLKLC